MENNRMQTEYLTLEVQQYFRVVSHNKSLTRNQNLSCFMVFLLKILDHEAPSFSKVQETGLDVHLQKKLEDIFNPLRHNLLAHMDQEPLYSLLQENITFLHAILGDVPLQSSEDEDTANLLIELESVANEAGSFIYSIFSSPTEELRRKNFYAGIHGLLEKAEIFINEKIKAHCSKELPTTATSRTKHLSSLFIVESLHDDLEGLMNGRLDLNIDDFMALISSLYEELTVSLPLLKDIEKSKVLYINDELQEFVIHIIDLTYEAEYLINNFTAVHIPSWYLNVRLPIIIGKIQVTRKKVMDKINTHGVKKKAVRPMRHHDREEANVVVGFKGIGKKILEDLVGGSKKLQIISVNGMSGIGKTTLAKKLYSEGIVSEYFDLRVWCTVSQAYDKCTVLDEIRMNLPRKSGTDDMLSLESLEVIYKTLIGRRYLIVMDDVWDSHVWDDLRRCFPDVGDGSRILFTSQMNDSAPVGSIFHHLPLLSNSECYKLLTKKVRVPSKSVRIAQRIASKCHGLPLTVVVVAGILANMGTEESIWEDVERNMDSYISDDSSVRMLELSYKYLPNNLKPCFLCLGWSFHPKGIPIRKLIPLWISHGFVQKGKNKSLEDIAEAYLLGLINGSLLSVSKRRSDGGIKECAFHDLVYDMCRRMARKEMFYNHVNEFSPFIYREQPHLVFPSELINICNISAPHCRFVSIRTSAVGHIVAQMPLLRVIENGESPIDENRLGGLVYLRYFSSYVQIKELPDGLYKLVNLEYLILDTGSKVTVPSDILKMVKLRQIHIGSQVIFLKTCEISQIKNNNVKSLSRVCIRNHEDEYILKCSTHLYKLKCICEGLFPDLISLTLLESLNISVFDLPPMGKLTDINLPLTLKKVTLCGTNLPWEESKIVGRLPNLHVLKLHNDAFRGNEWRTRDDEFQELKFLKIYNILSLQLWTTASEHFPKLQCLVMDHVRVEIPLEFGDIATLLTIEVRNCGDEVYESASQVEEAQHECGNEDFKIIAPDGISDLREDQGLTKATHKNPEVESPARSAQPQASVVSRICDGCKREIHGRFRILKGSFWHDNCLSCHSCKEPAYIHEYMIVDDIPYHKSCYKELHHSKCYICEEFVPTNADGTFDSYTHPFWHHTHCNSHKTDGTSQCCSCSRYLARDSTYLIHNDDRAVCSECEELSLVMNTEECEPLHTEIQDYFHGLNIKLEHQIPVRLVNIKAVSSDGVVTSHVCATNGISTEIRISYGLPRIKTGDLIAFQMMHTWVFVEGREHYFDLTRKVRFGICQLLTHMWLEHESEKGKLSGFQKKLADYYRYMIENNLDIEFKVGFWEAKKAVEKYGLRPTVDHICQTGTVPN